METNVKKDNVQEFKSSKQKNSGRGKKFTSRRGQDSDFPQKSFVRKGPNDIKWRVKSELAKLAGTLPFGFASGLKYEVASNSYNGTRPLDYTVPGIMAIRLKVTAGRANDYNAAANLCFRKSYSFIRHANSGSKNYEAVDLGMYYVATAQALALLGWLQRIYKTITKFSSTNRYYPRELLDIQGLNYDDLKKHQAELAWLIRWLGNAINSLSFPKMSFFDASYYAFSKYFEDNTSPKQQVYLLAPFAFGVYNPTYNTNGGGIDYTQILPPYGTATHWTYDDLYAAVHSIMDVLLSDEDIGIISGDILKAYGDSGLFKAIAESDSDISFDHSEEVLQQIHNCTIVDPGWTNLIGYKQNPGTTSTAPYMQSDIDVPASASTSDTNRFLSQYIDAFSAEPNHEEVFNCSVLKACVRTKPASSGSNHVPDPTTFQFGMYLPCMVTVYTGVGASVDMYNTLGANGTVLPTVTRLGVSSTLDNVYGRVLQFTNFDWHPLLPVNLQYGATLDMLFFIGDLQNLNFFSDVVFQRIHDTEMLSLFEFTE